MHTNNTIIESQVDWLTATRSSELRDPFWEWLQVRLLREEAEKGNEQEKWAGNGYIGTRCGRFRAGSSTQGELVILSGDLASKHLATLLPLCTNISRIDLAVTVRLPVGYADLERALYDVAKQNLDLHSVPYRRANLITSSDGGATLYVGGRSSECFLRVYNKGVESLNDPRYKNCHRAELELKGATAFSTARMLVGAPDQHMMVRDMVSTRLNGWKLPAFWDHGQQLKLESGFSRRTDASSRLRWLREQVRPAVTWLREAGFENEVDAALAADAEEQSLGLEDGRKEE